MVNKKGKSELKAITVLSLVITFTASGIAGEVAAPAPQAVSPPVTLQAAAIPVPASPPSMVTAMQMDQPEASAQSLPAAPPSSGKPTPVISAPPGEKDPDRVLSQTEVERELSKGKEEWKPEDVPTGFFVSAKTGDKYHEEGLYNGLMGRIDKFINYFQNRGRGKFELYLTRSGKYADMMRSILAKYGLPGDLIYLALIESGFSPKAYSVARAAGPWQFIADTGRRYGLRIDWWTDERRDYEKSTHAAASYLKDLYDMFDSWPLAAAAYNAGEGKILKAVNRYNSADYVELIRHRYLKQETKDYVPKMIAALTIAKEPEKYGFGDVQYEAPLVFDKVVVPGGTELAALGRIIGVPYESLREWNPELRRFCTPPNRDDYELRLPEGYGAIAQERMEDISTEARVVFLLHGVKKGETLSSLAEKYHTSVPVLQELNGLKKPVLGRTAKVVIPITGLSEEESVPGKEVTAQQVEAALKRLDENTRKSRTVKVRKGETLRAVANRTGIPIEDLAAANGLNAKSRVKAGRKLKLPGEGNAVSKKETVPANGGKKEMRHVVRRGETLSKISRVYGVTIEKLYERNQMKEGQTLAPGRVLHIPLES